MSGWLAAANLGSEMIGRRHAAHFQKQAATKAFDRQVFLKQWDERLANSAYQRSVADMRAAGLNPILAATKGVPPAAGAPSSSVSPGSAPGGSSAVDFAGSSAKVAQADLSKSAIDVNSAQAGKLKSEEALNYASIPLKDAEKVLLIKRAETEGWQPERIQAEIKRLEAGAGYDVARTGAVPSEILRNVASAKHSDAQSREIAAHIPVLVEQVRSVRAQGRLTSSQADAADLALVKLRQAAEIAGSDIGKSMQILESLGPLFDILESSARMESFGRGPGLRYQRR